MKRRSRKWLLLFIAVKWINGDGRADASYSLVSNIGDTWVFKKSSDQTGHFLDRCQLHFDLLAQLFSFA